MVKIGRNQPCPCGSGKKYKNCCLHKDRYDSRSVPKQDDLDVLMEQGYSLSQDKEMAKASDVWLVLWDKLKSRFKPEFRNVEQAETIFSGTDLIHNWCQDLENALEHAGRENPEYFQKRIEYCHEFCLIFPESGELLLHNMKRAAAESHFALGNLTEGDRCFEELIEQYPKNIWGYIGWGDMYAIWIMNNNIDPDYDKAEKIYKMALGMGLEDEGDLIDRLEGLKSEREKKT